MIVCTVYDNKAKYYLNPFITTSQGEALRQFIAAANDALHPFCQFAADFTVWHIGDFDPETGNIVLLPARQELARAWEVKNITIAEHLETPPKGTPL